MPTATTRMYQGNAICCLETTTAATTLPAGAIGRSRGDVLDTADLHAGTGEGAEGRLGTGAGGLGAVTTLMKTPSAKRLSSIILGPILCVFTVARILMCRLLMPSSLQRTATS